MNFKTFLLQENRTTTVDLSKAVEIYKTHCNKCDIDHPFMRASRSVFDYRIYNTRNSHRKLKGENYASTTVIDHLMKKEYGDKAPLRKEAILFTNKDTENHLKYFGNEVYYVFPYNDTLIGYIENKDYNYARWISGLDLLLTNENGIDRENSTYDELIDYIDRMSPEKIAEYSLRFDIESIEATRNATSEFIDKVLNLKTLKIGTCYNNAHFDKQYELWCSDDALLIHSKLYDEFKKLVND